MVKGIMLSALDSVVTVVGPCSLSRCGNSDVELLGFDNADCCSSNDITAKNLSVNR